MTRFFPQINLSPCFLHAAVAFCLMTTFHACPTAAQDGRLPLKNPLTDYNPQPRRDFESIEKVLRNIDVDHSSVIANSNQNSRLNRPNSESKTVLAGGLRDVLRNRFRPAQKKYTNVALQTKIRRVLEYNFNNPESADARSSWGVMHAAIAYGKRSEVISRGQRFNAIDWLTNNGSCRGHRLMYVQNDDLAVRNGPGYQGHSGQFLAILAQCNVKSGTKLRVNGREFTVVDLIRREMQTCEPKTELTFKLIGLSHYLESNVKWENESGSKWTIQRLIKEELSQPIVGVACGGSHRLMGLIYAIKRRRIQQLPIDGEFKRANDFIKEFVKYTMTLQNPDGSFSTKWFEGREADPNLQKRVQTTGHILEWLVFTLEPSELTDPRIVKSVNYLADLMWNNRRTKWAVGPRGHALRSLVLYNQRVFATNGKQSAMVPKISIDSTLLR